MRRRLTQIDIARAARVSQATVSRVLAGDERVDGELRDRIQRLAEQHNYIPDVRARSLRSSKTGLIGLVIRRPAGALMDDPFFARLVALIVDYLSRSPYHLCLELVDSERSERAVYDEMLRSRRVDGLILVESQASDRRIERLHTDNFPFILIGNPTHAPAIFSVDNDNVLAGCLAAEHLMDRGYRRIGFLAGPENLTVSKDRVAGFRQIAGEDAPVWHSMFGLGPARETAMELLLEEDRPEALVVLDDYMAFGAVQAARQIGLKIGNDLGLVSFNDSSLCELLEDGLSSVSLNLDQIVRRACELLLQSIEDPGAIEPKRELIPCELVARGSSRKEEVTV
jgi:DNA-binding LacI/PurR family transcriptional regulator